MATKVKQKIPENIQNSIDNIEKLIREDKVNQKNDKYKDFIYNILGKTINDGNYNQNNNTYEYELTKDDTQKLMYNISIIHYLIELKKLEIEKIKLNIDKDYVLLVKLKEKTDDVFIVKKKGCPSLKFKFPDEPLTIIDKLKKKQEAINSELEEIYEGIIKSSSANQAGGVGDNKDFINHLKKVGKLTTNFKSPYQTNINSKGIYNNLINYNNGDNKFKKDIIKVETSLEFSQEKQGEIQNLIITLKDLSDLYYQYHKIFINLVLIFKTLLQLKNQTSKVINKQILIIKEQLPKKIVSDTVAISDDCTIKIPKFNELKEIINKLKEKQNIILEINDLDKNDQNELKKILAEYKDDFLINNGGEVETNNKILIL